MTPQFLRAVIDKLIPGETVSGDPAMPALPSGSAAGLDLAPYAEAHRDVLRAIAERAGGEHSFAIADEAARVAILQSIEIEQPDSFRALVVHLLQDYYQTDVILTAMGWRTDPPQPKGHTLTPMATSTETTPNRARQKIKLWRD